MAEYNLSQTTIAGEMLTKTKLKKKSYTREKKLKILEFYKSRQSNVYNNFEEVLLTVKQFYDGLRIRKK